MTALLLLSAVQASHECQHTRSPQMPHYFYVTSYETFLICAEGTETKLLKFDTFLAAPAANENMRRA